MADSIAPSHDDGIVELTADLSGSPYYSHDMAPVPRARAALVDARHGRAVDFDVGLRADLHARVAA